TGDHGLIVDGYVVNASAMVNGSTIHSVPLSDLPAEFSWWHIETEAHEVILAEGAAAETFIDAAGRAAFDNHDAYLDRFGTERLIPEMRLPRITASRLLPESIRARLEISAASLAA
ncbi:MAG: Hint domain-containing protein, partial [Pseudomonadota bacterium]